MILSTDENLIDNINITDDEAVLLPSDHKAITFDININRKLKLTANRLSYNYSKGDFKSLRETLTLSFLPLNDIVESENNIDIAWSKWKDTFLAAVDTHIPKQQVRRSSTPPYITSDIIHALHKKDTLRKRANVGPLNV